MTDKVMRPIRKEEYAYWDYNTDSAVSYTHLTLPTIYSV